MVFFLIDQYLIYQYDFKQAKSGFIAKSDVSKFVALFDPGFIYTIRQIYSNFYFVLTKVYSFGK